MYAIYGNIYHQYTPNVSIYTIHGSYGIEKKNCLRNPISMFSGVAVYFIRLTKQDGWKELYILLVWSDAIQCTNQSSLLFIVAWFSHHQNPCAHDWLPELHDVACIVAVVRNTAGPFKLCLNFSEMWGNMRWLIGRWPIRFGVLQSPSNAVDFCPADMLIVWPKLRLFEWDQTIYRYQSGKRCTCFSSAMINLNYSFEALNPTGI